MKKQYPVYKKLGEKLILRSAAGAGDAARLGVEFAVDFTRAGTAEKRQIQEAEETTEILYAIGAGDRVVGVSAYTVRPPEAREKPTISALKRSTAPPSTSGPQEPT